MIQNLTHNEILDSEQHTCTVDLLKHLDNSHPLKALSVAVETEKPPRVISNGGFQKLVELPNVRSFRPF